MKSMVGLFLVLAIQLFQVQSSLASIASLPCVSGAKTSCCSGEEYCPCVTSAPEKESKTPLSPVSSETKAPEFIEPCTEDPSEDFLICFLPENHPPRFRGRIPSGYLGISLSVAFCRFVI